MNYEEIVKELDTNIPRDVIAKREGGNGKMLDYLEGWYVIDRLNKVLGIGRWAYTSNVNLVHSGEVVTSRGPSYVVHYIAQVRLVTEIGTTKTEFSDFGYGDGVDYKNIGKAHELAVKEAVTDGLKRCAKNLGLSMGLALYDKTREFVDEEDDKKADQNSNGGDTRRAPQAQGVQSTRVVSANGNRVQAVSKPGNNEVKKEKTTVDLIKEMQSVIFAKKISDGAALQALMKERWGVTSTAHLTPPQQEAFLINLKEMVKQ